MERLKRAALFTCVLACAALPYTAAAAVRISEVMYDADGTDSKREWVELYNEGPDAVNLTDWKIIDKSAHALNVPPKNGGLGSMMFAPGRYAILASDATIFAQEYPGISIVIDTAMSLNNSGGTVSLSNGKMIVDSMSYTKALGASDDGDSLQLHEGTWIHARPTPGAANATAPSIKIVQNIPAPATKKTAAAKPKATVSVARAESQSDIANDPLAIVNATSTDPVLAETATAGSLGGYIWWIAAAALAICAGAVASLISRTKKNEWDIEESE